MLAYMHPARVAYRLRRATILRQIHETRAGRSAARSAALRDLRLSLLTARRTLRQSEAEANRRLAA